MATPDFTAPPTMPSRRDTSTFSARFAAFLAWLTTFYNQMVVAVGWMAERSAAAETAAARCEVLADAALETALSTSDLLGTTADMLNVAVGVQAFDFDQAGLAFQLNEQLGFVLLGDEAVRMTGTLTAFNAGTGAATVNITRTQGAVATGAGWAVMRKALEGASPEQANALAIAFAVVL